MTTLKNIIVKIRKPRQCFSCYRKFVPGDKMNYYVCVDGGDLMTSYSCPACAEIMRLNPDDQDDGGFPEGFVKEIIDSRTRGEKTPEDVLANIIASRPPKTNVCHVQNNLQ